MIRPRFRHTGRPCCLILLCLLLLPWLGACAPQYGVSVDSLRGPQADNAGTVYVPRPGVEGMAEDDLLFRDVAAQLEPCFTARGYTLKLDPKWIVHPDYDPHGFTYFQFPSEGVGSPTLVLGLPLKSLLFDDSIPVDIHLEIPSHDVSVTLTGSVAPVVNSLSAPTDLIQDSDIASFVQLRQTLEQIAQLVQSTLNAIQ